MKLCGLTGEVVVPGASGYDQARQEWNRAIDKYPCVIVYCFSQCDVANAIVWSRKHNVELRIRSGGNNYEGYSTGNGKLIIDTTYMNDIAVNSEEDTVVAGAGTRLPALYEAAYRYGYAFPGGTCPSVAIGGLVLGGGIGLSARYLGLTADNLMEASLIDANGSQLIANAYDNPGLFWALRGAGGGNFGVTTSYKFSLRKVDKITLIQLEWHNNKPARMEFLQVWQTWLAGLDRRLSAFGGIYKQGAWLNAFFYGEPKDAEIILQPILAIPGITYHNIQYLDFIEAVKKIGAGYPDGEAFKSTGRFVQRQLSPHELVKVIEIIDAAPTEASSYISVYSLGGAIRDVPKGATAFFYRQAEYIMGISSTWTNGEAAASHKKWVAGGFKYIYTVTAGSYINFPYAELPAYEQAYFGAGVSYLRYIKQMYDPENVFRFPQSIRLGECG